MSPWRPNALQWCIIWAAVLTAAHVWLGLRISDWWGNQSGGWGLPAYLYPVTLFSRRTQFAVVILAIGALLVWQVSGWRKK